MKILSPLLMTFMSFFLLSTANAQSTLEKHLRKKMLICGHRGGYDMNLPENSIALFSQNANLVRNTNLMIELDVRKNADGTLFVMHDDSLDRTTTGTGNIKDVSSQYLKSLFLKSANGKISKEKIPTLASVLDWASKSKNIFLMVDVKDNVWEEVLQAIKAKKMIDKCLILTFSIEHLKKVHDMLPDIWISTLINTENDLASLEATNISYKRLIAYITAKTSDDLIDRIKKNNIYITTDVGENVKKHLSPFLKEYYVNLVKNKQLNILITDYPVDVHLFFH